MDQTARYTDFPNLYNTVHGQHRHAQRTLQSDWPVALPQELLILSWATLLQSYTGITEPVLDLEGKSIQVNVPFGSWTEVEVDNANRGAGHHTSITLNQVGSQQVGQAGGYTDPSLVG